MLSDIFDFIINFFTACLNWVFNLSIPLGTSVNISFGVLLLSFVVFGLAIRVIWSIFIKQEVFYGY